MQQYVEICRDLIDLYRSIENPDCTDLYGAKQSQKTTLMYSESPAITNVTPTNNVLEIFHRTSTAHLPTQTVAQCLISSAKTKSI